MKRIISLLCCFAIIFLVSATEKNETHAIENELVFEFNSPEFENAYILTEYHSLNSQSRSNVQSANILSSSLTNSDIPENSLFVTATVFVSETYETIDGKKVVKSSRLLSEDEVEEIGVENFENINNMSTNTNAAEAEESKGKLSIGMLCYESSRTATSSQYEIAAIAKWDGFSFITINSLNPAVGEDFFGLCWFGDFAATNSGCTVEYEGLEGSVFDAELSDAKPNAGRVWFFEELIDLDAIKYYANPVSIYATLRKNNLTGGGNNAELVLQYTHTYRELEGSVTINTDTANFTVNGTDKQWSISCVVSNLYY